MCAARAISVCMAALNGEKRYKDLVRKGREHSKSKASATGRGILLMNAINLPIEKPVLLRDLYKFEEYLNVQIIVISGDHNDRVTYTGSRILERKIFLYLKSGHFHSITSIDKFFAKHMKLCKNCFAIYSSNALHSCEGTCDVCHNDKCKYEGDGVKCLDCNMLCRNNDCFERHKHERVFKTGAKKGTPRPSYCENYHKCVKCGKRVNVSERAMAKHVCGERFCQSCASYVVGEHYCYHRAFKPKDNACKNSKFLFYDIETIQTEINECEKGYTNNPVENCDQCAIDTDGTKWLCSTYRRRNYKMYQCGLHEHQPCFIVSQSACEICQDEVLTPMSKCFHCGTRCPDCWQIDQKTGLYAKQPCENNHCGLREVVFKGFDSGQRFGEFLFNESHQNFTVLAHNARGFDSLFLLNYCIHNSVFPGVIYSGSKIMHMHVKDNLNIRLIDSLNFLPFRLKDFPKALDLPCTVRKYDFPHAFSCRENFSYEGPYPEAHFYNPDNMNPKERAEFLEWHSGLEGKIFNFQNQMLLYNRNDVEILRLGCLKFRQLMLKLTRELDDENIGVDPFQSVTIASCCMKIFKQLFMTEVWHAKLKDNREGLATYRGGVWRFEDSGERFSKHDIEQSTFIKSDIPCIPANGYMPQSNHSRKAIVWLEYLSLKLGRQILHARNGPEFKPIMGERITCDGYLPSLDEKCKGHLFEFLGCHWHHHNCLPAYRGKKARGTDKDILYKLSMDRLEMLKSKGYEVTFIWECEYEQLICTDPDLRKLSNTIDLPMPLKIRDSFYGGRTCPAKLFYEAKDDAQIKYKDVTSLYPYINKFAEYPVSHPQIIRYDFDYTLDSYYGFVQAKVLAPRGLYIPVLPLRCNSRLKFPLCRTCSSLEESRKCLCNDEERALTGVWCTPELQEALRQGYTILKIYCVMHYPETKKFNSETMSGGLFSQYVDMFFKIKQEASGYPNGVESEADKDSYIEEFHAKQGILLDKEKIEQNPAIRLIAKQCLNSLWGKFSERQNRTRNCFITTPDELFKIVNNPTIEWKDFHFINDNVVLLEYCSKQDHVTEDNFSNVAIGSMTTSFARLHLLKILQKANQNAIYWDTDSIIYAQKSNEPELLPTGPLLGELTDELGPGTYIQSFISTGPKSYAYKLSNGETCVKVKGITLNYATSQVINFDSMRDVLLTDTEIKTPFRTRFKRDKIHGQIFNIREQKTFKLVYTKRVLQPDYDSLPFGY